MRALRILATLGVLLCASITVIPGSAGAYEIVQVVTAWLGNSPQIAAKHYLQVTEEHYQKALQNPMQYAHEQPRKASQGEQGEGQKQGVYGGIQKETALCGNTEPSQAPRLGLEPRT